MIPRAVIPQVQVPDVELYSDVGRKASWQKVMIKLKQKLQHVMIDSRKH